MSSAGDLVVGRRMEWWFGSTLRWEAFDGGSSGSVMAVRHARRADVVKGYGLEGDQT